MTSEFGRTVRRWRDRLEPAAAGLPAGQRRRAAGLRREELAGIAGISADYLTRLEQGRATSPSAQVVEALARALRLSDAERDLLFALAGHAAPGRDVMPSRITRSVQRLLDRLEHTPVAVFDAALTLLVANAPYDALMGDTTSWQGLERNALWRHFAGLGGRVAYTAEGERVFEETVVGTLRMTASRYPADHALRRLVERLTAASPRFAELWDADLPLPTAEVSKRKTIEHPTVGPITLDCDTLVVATDDVRIMVYTADPGTPDAERLELAVVVGTQALVE